jgi:hypothetical protein
MWRRSGSGPEVVPEVVPEVELLSADPTKRRSKRFIGMELPLRMLGSVVTQVLKNLSLFYYGSIL